MLIRVVLNYFLLCFITVVNCENQWQIEEKKVIKTAREENRPIVAVFLGEDCPWSKKLQQEILESPHFLEKINAEAILWINSLKLNEEKQIFIQKYKVQQCPLFLLLDPNGKEFARFEYIPLDVQGHTETIINQIENFQEICIALDQDGDYFEEEKWQELYQKAKKLSVPCFQQVIFERGLRKETGNYFHLEKFKILLEKYKLKHPQVCKAKQQLLNRDPENKLGIYFKVAVLESQKIA
jgi:thioredoxin-related protein